MYCRNCGAEASQSDRFCHNCGEDITSERDANIRKTKRSGRAPTTGREVNQPNRNPRQNQSENFNQDSTRNVDSKTLGTPTEEGIIRYSMNYVTSKGLKPLGIGSILYFANYLLIPYIVLSGYVYELTAKACRGESVQPEYSNTWVEDENWKRLSIKGTAFSFLQIILFLAIYLVPLFIGIGLQNFEVIGSILYIGSFLVIAYLTPAIMTLYAATDSLAEALQPKNIIDFSLNKTYCAYFLLYSFVIVTSSIIIGFASFILLLFIVGLFILPILYPILLTLAYYLSGAYWGAVYYKVQEEDNRNQR